MVVVVNLAVPAQSIAELIKLAKAKPGELAYATPGHGTSTHLASELFKQQAGIDMRHVPYRANPLAMNDVIGGQVPVFMDLVTTGAPHVRGGKVRGLATTGPKRSPVLPELPTMIEAGVPDFDVTTWIAVFAAGGTPRDTVARCIRRSPPFSPCRRSRTGSPLSASTSPPKARTGSARF